MSEQPSRAVSAETQLSSGSFTETVRGMVTAPEEARILTRYERVARTPLLNTAGLTPANLEATIIDRGGTEQEIGGFRTAVLAWADEVNKAKGQLQRTYGKLGAMWTTSAAIGIGAFLLTASYPESLAVAGLPAVISLAYTISDRADAPSFINQIKNYKRDLQTLRGGKTLIDKGLAPIQQEQQAKLPSRKKH